MKPFFGIVLNAFVTRNLANALRALDDKRERRNLLSWGVLYGVYGHVTSLRGNSDLQMFQDRIFGNLTQ